MQKSIPPRPGRVALERWLAGGAVAACILATLVPWQPIAAQQAMWPLPGLYFLEMIAVSAAGMLAIFRGSLTRLAWAAVGALLGFAALGVLTVGVYFLPSAVLLAGAEMLSSRRLGRNWVLGLGVAGLAAIVQVGIVLALISTM